MKNLKIKNTRDGFDMFTRKLCVAPSGWQDVDHLLSNARWLFVEAANNGKEWPNIHHTRLNESKTGQKLKAYLLDGTEEVSGDVTFIKEFLADFGLWGIANVSDDEIGAVS